MKPDSIQGVNLGYVVELYERYRENPDSVDPATRALFETWRPVDPTEPLETAHPSKLHVIVGVANLAECIRRYGHLAPSSIRSARSHPAIRRCPLKHTA